MKILLVEDDASIRAVAVLSLSRVGKHTVTVAENGKIALEMVAKDQYDLILLDVMMPEMDGFEACRQLKENPITKDIPVIFLTAKAQVYEMRQGINLGAVGYIIKPFDPMTLSVQIKEIMESHGVTPRGTKAA